jgi:16S rRNA (guanine(966)-N(2))-methyltransferase RsmD
MDTRPTQDKVKESLFSMIQWDIPDACVLDLFAGSGALALESLSRGAGEAVLVDKSREALDCIRKNIAKLRMEQQTTVLSCDWEQALVQLGRTGKTFDLVFLDPPYRMTDLGSICNRMLDLALLAPEAVLVLEHRTGIELSLPECFSLIKERSYGETQIHFYRWEVSHHES